MAHLRGVIASLIVVLVLCATAIVTRVSRAVDDKPVNADAGGAAPSPVPEAPDDKLAAKTAEVAILRAQVESARDLLSNALKKADDPDVTPTLLKAAHAKAKEAVKQAELEAKEYAQRDYPQQEQAASVTVKLAEVQAEWAKDQDARIQSFASKLAAQKAEFELKEAQTQLMILQKYTREKQRKDYAANVEHAISEELETKMAIDREWDRHKGERGPDSRNKVLLLLDEAVALDDVVIKRLRNAREMHTRVAGDLGRAKRMQDELRTLRTEVAALVSRADEDSRDALEIADEILASRAVLREKETGLEQALAELDMLKPR
jgi:hypothetical protein